MWIAENNSHLGVGRVIRGHDGSWITRFTHFENDGDALLVELRAIQLGIATCYDFVYTNIICESGYLEAVNLIHNFENASLHV